MPCRHIVKYMILALAFGSCLTYTQATALATAPDLSPSMLIPKCEFILCLYTLRVYAPDHRTIVIARRHRGIDSRFEWSSTTTPVLALVKVTTMTDLNAFSVQHTLDVAPPLLPANIVRNDADAIAAAHELAAIVRTHAAMRDRERQLPWSEIELFTRSGLGGISVPRIYGGPQVSFVTLAEVFAILSAADPAVGQIPQNHFGILNSLIGSASEAQKQTLFASVLGGARIGNGGPERGTKNTLDVRTRITADGRGQGHQ
jgi:hypothetical protein